jgi:hypothetical protein
MPPSNYLFSNIHGLTQHSITSAVDKQLLNKVRMNLDVRVIHGILGGTEQGTLTICLFFFKKQR